MALHVGLSIADPSSNAPAIRVATNAPLDVRFIDHYVAPGKLNLGGSSFLPNVPKFGTRGPYYQGNFFGLETTIDFYKNMVLVRATIPGEHRTIILSELSKRYGPPSKITEDFSSWDVKVDGELRHITLHKNAVLERTVNGKKQPLPDEARLDIARMKSEKDKQESSEPNEIEAIVTPQTTNAPYSQPGSQVEKR